MSLPDELIEKLFKRLAAMYGARFADMWLGTPDEDVKRAWAADLARFTEDTLRKGIEVLRDNNPFPPTGPEFVRICRDIQRATTPKQTDLSLPNYPDPNSEEMKAAQARFFENTKALGLKLSAPVRLPHHDKVLEALATQAKIDAKTHRLVELELEPS